MVRGTTKTGFVFEADENVMATWKAAKAIAKTQSDEGAEQLAGAVELVEDILGKKQEKALMKHLRKVKGTAMTEDVMTEIFEIVDCIRMESEKAKNS